MKRLILDFLFQDDLRQSAGASKLIGQAETCDTELVWDRMVVTEIVYVLMGHYKWTRVEVANSCSSELDGTPRNRVPTGVSGGKRLVPQLN